MGGDLHIISPSLPSTPRKVPSGHGTESSILYLHSPGVRPKVLFRPSGHPLIQDSLNGSNHFSKALKILIILCLGWFRRKRHGFLDPWGAQVSPVASLKKNNKRWENNYCWIIDRTSNNHDDIRAMIIIQASRPRLVDRLLLASTTITPHIDRYPACILCI